MVRNINDVVKRLEKVAKYAHPGSEGFAIYDFMKLKNDLDELVKEKAIKPFFYKSVEEVEEELRSSVETFGGFGAYVGMPLFDLTKKGANELKKAKDNGELNGKEYRNIILNLGWRE